MPWRSQEAPGQSVYFSFLFFFLIYFIYLAASGLSCSTRDLHCNMRDLSLQHTGSSSPRAGSVVVAHGLSCHAACGILVPRPGIEPESPALEGGFLTTGPPGKSQHQYFKYLNDLSLHS